MTINEKLRLFIVFAGVGHLVEIEELTADDVVFTNDEMARVHAILDKMADGDEMPPEYLPELKSLFRESLDAFLALEVPPIAAD